jgi:hypothetical protein
MIPHGVGRADVLATFLVLVPLSSAWAAVCPDLNGTFECPGRGDQMPMTMVVTTKPGASDTVTYTFTYIRAGEETSLQVQASPQGIKAADGKINSCSGASYFRKGATEQGEGTRNFINAAGNFEAVNSGRTQIVCTRKAR